MTQDIIHQSSFISTIIVGKWVSRLDKKKFLFPYLFHLCGDGLNSLLHNATTNGEITMLRISRTGSKISQVLFVDDILLFCKASVVEGEEILTY